MPTRLNNTRSTSPYDSFQITLSDASDDIYLVTLLFCLHSWATGALLLIYGLSAPESFKDFFWILSWMHVS
jgi:hypothetical protein